MGYTIELSFNIRARRTNGISSEEIIYNLLDKHNSPSSYTLHETEGTSINTLISKKIVVISYDYDDILHCANFIREIKKQPLIYIECIYEDETIYKLLYASSRYLKKLDKKTSRKFKKDRKNNIYSDEENILLQQIYKN